MDISQQLQEQVLQAIAQKQALRIEGGNSKAFYGNELDIPTLSTAQHNGIIAYEPSELFIKAHTGTPLSEIEALLAENQQMLAFEPPQYAENTTIGGVVATGLSGPARPWQGGVRDHMLGTKLLTGTGKIASFGGQVMKNVAGYDVSRLMVGAQGTLGLLLDVTLKVIPKQPYSQTLAAEMSLDEATEYSIALRKSRYPLSGLCYYEDCLYIRLSGEETLVKQAQNELKGDELANAEEFWQSIRNQTHEFFQQKDRPLWRLSLRPNTREIGRLEGHTLVEWGGAQRWVYSHVPTNIIRSIALKNKGHATLYRGDVEATNPFQTLPEQTHQLQIRLKQALDPHGIFNAGRMYPSI